MTVGGGGGGGGEGMSSMRDCVSEFTPGAIAFAKLAATACAGAGTGWLPVRIPCQSSATCYVDRLCIFSNGPKQFEIHKECTSG